MTEITEFDSLVIEAHGYALLLLAFEGKLNKEQKIYLEVLGLDFERWNETVKDLLAQITPVASQVLSDCQ